MEVGGKRRKETVDQILSVRIQYRIASHDGGSMEVLWVW
jgi:hypothetical protein